MTAPKPPLPTPLPEIEPISDQIVGDQSIVVPVTSPRSQVSVPANSEPANKDMGAFWGVFLSTFITIFLAELGDKTQVATLLLSAQSHAPVVVFLGAGLALIATSLIGVSLGQWMSKRVSEEALDTCAGVILLLITIGLVGDIVGR